MQYVRLGRTGLKVSRLCLGTMNFGPLTTRSRQLRHHGPRARARHQLLRHRQRLRLEDRRGRHRADHRPLVRAGRRPARAHRARDQGLRAHGRRARTTRGCRRSTSAARATRACAACRPTTSTSTRCTTSTASTPWDEIWQAMERAGRAGQGDLRRQQQLRRLAHRAGAAARPRSRHFLGLVSEQSLYNLTARTIELEVIPACRAHGLGVIPWSPLARRAARRRARQADGGPARVRSAAQGDRAQPRQARGVREPLPRARRGAGRRRARVAAAQPGRHARRSSARARWSSWRRARARWSSRSISATLERLDRIWPGPGGEAPEAYAW